MNFVLNWTKEKIKQSKIYQHKFKKNFYAKKHSRYSASHTFFTPPQQIFFVHTQPHGDKN